MTGQSYCRSRGPGVRFGAVVANSSDSLIPAAPTERRPAIWPWLVMPLVTLALYYALDTLKHSLGDESHSDAGQVAESSSAETGTP